MTDRPRRVVICLGAPLSGKSTIAKGLLADLRKHTDGRPLAVIDPGGQFKGGFMPAGNDVEGWLEVVKPPDPQSPAKVRGILFDDGDGYLPRPPKAKSAFLDLCLRHRWWRTDVIVTARRAQNIAPQLWSAAELAFVFRCSRADRTARERLDEFAPGLVIPSEPYRFVCRNLYTDEEVHGRTKPAGGFEVVR